MIDDIYRVKLFQTYFEGGDEILNVFYYKQITPGGTNEGAEHLGTVWEAALGPAIRAIQSSAIFWTSLEVANIIPSADFATIPYTATDGERTGECLPPQDCYSFRLNRATSASRNGQKRFCGVSETDQGGGIALGPIVPLLANVALLLDDILGGPPPADATYQPIIFRPGRPAKTIPAKTIPAVLQSSFPIQNASYVSIGTQNTRKRNS